MKIFFSLLLLALTSLLQGQNHLLPQPGSLQYYLDTTQGKEWFPSHPVDGLNQQDNVAAFLKNTLLTGDYLFTREYTRNSPDGNYYTYNLAYNNIPVYGRQAKVFTDNNSVIRWVFFNLPVLSNPKNTIFFADDKLAAFFQSRFPGQVLTGSGKVWMDNNGELIPAFLLSVKNPAAYTVDEYVFSTEGNLLYTRPLYSRYAANDTPAYVYVYDPDPLTTAHMPYGGSYSNNGGQDNNLLQAQLKKRLTNAATLNDSVVLSNDRFYINEVSGPTWPQTRAAIGDTLRYSRTSHSFCEVNAFYHLNTYTDYVHGMGYTQLPGYRIQVDAHAFNGGENSQFTPGDHPPSLQFGDGGIPDAEDAEVIIHEFGHGLAYGAAPNTDIGSERLAIDEGLGDYMATSYSKAVDSFNWTKVFNWDGNNGGWQGRTVNYGVKYPTLTNSKWTDGQIWSTGFMRINIYTSKAVADKLMFESLYRLSPNITMPKLANAVLQIDSIKYAGAHSIAIQCAFSSVGVLPAPPSGCTFGVKETVVNSSSLFNLSNTWAFANGNGDALVTFITENNYRIFITDISGKIIWNTAVEKGESSAISSQKLPAGVYFITVENEDGIRGTAKLLRY